MKRVVLSAGILVCLGGLTFSAAAQIPGEIVPNRLVVTFKSGAAPAEAVAADLARGQGVQVRHVFRHALRGMVIDVAAAAAPRALNALRRDPRVASAGYDRYAAAVADSVPKGINRINAEPGVGANTGSGVRVAIIDTGLDFNHPDLGANVNTSLSRNCIGGCVEGGQDDQGHGTFVGGIIAATANGSQLIGAAPAATLVAIKVLNSSGSGSFGDITASLDYLRGLNNDESKFIHVANMSLGARCSVCTDNSTDPTIAAFHTATRELVNSGTTVVVAAGNDGVESSTSVPASFDEVITVSALTDTDGQPGGRGPSILLIGLGRLADDSFAKFSNYGADVDVIGPGVNETSLALGGGTSSGSGTSFSSPHAAAVAAIFICDQLNKTGSRPSPATVRQALIETGECYQSGGNGTTFHGSFGCNQVWPGDKDTFAEPLVRADNIANFVGGSLPAFDVAVTSVTPPSSPTVNTTETVSVGVANQGTNDATFTFTLTLSDDLAATISGAQEVTLAAGASTTVNFSWTPTEAGTHTLTATAQLTDDENLANNSKSATVEVSAEPAGGGFTLAVTGYKVKGLQKADLSWSGATSTSVDVYRNGAPLTTTANDGAHTDNIDKKGGGSYTYKVCEVGTSTCSNEATITF